MGPNRAPRALRPHPHLEPLTTRTALARVRPALQRASSAPQPRSTRTQRCRSCRVSARPTDPTTPHLQWTHQPVPTSSLNHPQWPTQTSYSNFNAPTPPLHDPTSMLNTVKEHSNAFPAPTRRRGESQRRVVAGGHGLYRGDLARGTTQTSARYGSVVMVAVSPARCPGGKPLGVIACPSQW
jgi:hypothetical protein